MNKDEAVIVIDQMDFQSRYEDLVKRFDNAKEKYDTVCAEMDDKRIRCAIIDSSLPTYPIRTLCPPRSGSSTNAMMSDRSRARAFCLFSRTAVAKTYRRSDFPPVHRLAGIFVMGGEKLRNVREAQWMRSASAGVSTFGA